MPNCSWPSSPCSPRPRLGASQPGHCDQFLAETGAPSPPFGFQLTYLYQPSSPALLLQPSSAKLDSCPLLHIRHVTLELVDLVSCHAVVELNVPSTCTPLRAAGGCRVASELTSCLHVCRVPALLSTTIQSPNHVVSLQPLCVLRRG